VAAARSAAWSAAWSAAAGSAAWSAAELCGWSAVELCGWSKLRNAPYFLPIMGVVDPVAWVESINPQANRDREAFIASQM
jgi:hypothetical protein